MIIAFEVDERDPKVDTPDQPTSDQAKTRTYYVPQLRIASGLILFTFVITHFINHGLGLVSVNAMQAGQDIRVWVTESGLGMVLLIVSVLIKENFATIRGQP